MTKSMHDSTPVNPAGIPIDVGRPMRLHMNGAHGDMPFVGGASIPLFKESDPETAKPQPVPFFGSVLFRLWVPEDLARYNELMSVLSRWASMGWGNYDEKIQEVGSEKSWTVWVRFLVFFNMMSDDRAKYLADINVLNLGRSAGLASVGEAYGDPGDE